MTTPCAAHLLVLAKEPVAGRAKTRLTPPLDPRQAAQVARAALLDTLAVVARVPGVRRTVVLDGSPDGWLPPGFAVLPQRGGAARRNRRSRRELLTTSTEEAAMAIPASMGLSRPRAATGMSTAL